jgi:hypothetical protein
MPVARVIDERLLGRRVHLPHRGDFKPRYPGCTLRVIRALFVQSNAEFLDRRSRSSHRDRAKKR